MASDIADLVGTFTCTVSNGRETPNTAEIVLNGECLHNSWWFVYWIVCV